MSRFKGVLAQSGIISKVLMLVGITVIFSVLSVFLWQSVSNTDLTKISSLKSLQFFQSIGTFIIPPLVLAYFWSKKPTQFLQFRTKNKIIIYFYLILFMLIIIPFVNLLGFYNQQISLPEYLGSVENWMKVSEAQAQHFTEQLLNVHSTKGLLFNIMLVALIPALGEELFFRGAIQGIFSEWKNVIIGIWIAAFIFSTIHLQFYGFIPRLLLGAFFGYLLFWSGNMWLPVVAHFTNNLVSVLFYYFKNNGYQVPEFDTIGTGTTLWLGIASGALGVFGVFWLKKQLQREI